MVTVESVAALVNLLQVTLQVELGCFIYAHHFSFSAEDIDFWL